MVGRICKAGLCTFGDLEEWRYDWPQIWRMVDMLDVHDWVEWQYHVIMEQKNKAGR